MYSYLKHLVRDGVYLKGAWARTLMRVGEDNPAQAFDSHQKLSVSAVRSFAFFHPWEPNSGFHVRATALCALASGLLWMSLLGPYNASV